MSEFTSVYERIYERIYEQQLLYADLQAYKENKITSESPTEMSV